MEAAIIIDSAINLITLTILELVFGVDNLIFIAIISNKLPQARQKMARRFGLMLALVMRIILLACAYWLIHLTTPLFSIYSMEFSGRDLFLIFGGLFLLYKATDEIHAEFEKNEIKAKGKNKFNQLWMVIVQIALLDIIFSLDSVITAVGMTNSFWIMATAIAIAIAAMIFIAEPLSAFIQRNPTVRMLAFSFLLMVGMVLVADGVGLHIPRGYVYFAVAFSIFVEILNLIRRGRHNKRTAKRVKK